MSVPTSELGEAIARVEELERRLTEANEVVASWELAGQNLTVSAAQARAKNQSQGKGLGGILFGAKYRAAARRSASASNAAIAREVADKRAEITTQKQQAKGLVSVIKQELAKARADVRRLEKPTAAKAHPKQQAASIDLLKKLAEARDLGLLSEQEFEDKRRNILSRI